ncbi:lysylphosphatidylglycerol synthase transmembrane domain-containing protein [Roseicyclus elongatus]|uniref:lysylphosphatidylglycerol synthase transmembrane domain-containing protein n=1 Tax=Roseicyclus elongatus TaxID=159346 RepID=UPI000A05FC4D|nr:lysylphosphatidylglycerol synthase transmembrane domain-containing protein [Roseibacterium elongatum]
MRLHIPRWVVRLLQGLVAVGLLALLWRAADGPDAARRLATADWRWLALGFLALSAQTLLSALRWRLTARQLGIALGKAQAISEYYLSQIVNQSLPGGVIGDAGRALRSRGQAGLMAAGQAVVFERLAGQIAMFLMLATAFVATLVVPGGLDWPRWLAWPVAIFLACGACLPLLAMAATHLPGAAGRSGRSLWQALHRALAARGALLGQVLLSVGTTVCNLAAFAFCARAVGIDLGLAAIAALVPLILFTMLVPISISGWGLREGAAAALFPLAGATASGGLATSVAFGLTFAAAVLPGFLMLLLGPRAKRWKTGQERTEDPNGTMRRA